MELHGAEDVQLAKWIVKQTTDRLREIMEEIEKIIKERKKKDEKKKTDEILANIKKWKKIKPPVEVDENMETDGEPSQWSDASFGSEDEWKEVSRKRKAPPKKAEKAKAPEPKIPQKEGGSSSDGSGLPKKAKSAAGTKATPTQASSTNRDAPSTSGSQEAAKSASATSEKKERRPPPIFIREEGHLADIKRELETRGTKPREMKNTREGVRVLVNTGEDYRILQKILTERKIGYHTYQLPDQKEYKVVLRGVPTEIKEDDVKKELEEQKFEINSVKRLKNAKVDYPMVLINARKTEKSRELFALKNVQGFRVTTEPKRKPTNGQQCFRCQTFGHVQFRCTAEERCLWCAGRHASRACPHKEKRNFRPKCANCSGEHISSSWDCLRHPVGQEKKRKEVPQEKGRSLAAPRAIAPRADARPTPDATTGGKKFHHEVRNIDKVEALSEKVEKLQETLEQLIKRIR